MRTFYPTPNTDTTHYLDLGASVQLAATLHRFSLDAYHARLEYCITCIYRSHAEQARLYAQGRTTTGKVVTNAKPGQSRHNDHLNGDPASTAVDMCPIIDGKPSWSKTGAALVAWQKMGDIASECGLEWARNIAGMKHDWPHFQLPRTRAPNEGGK